MPRFVEVESNCNHRELTEFEKTQQEQENIWLKAWATVAGGSACITKESPTNYADQCLADFKRRFR